MRANARDLLKNIEQRVQKQSLDVSISSINEKNSKTMNKLREASKFMESMYTTVENLVNDFEEVKGTRDYIQELEDNLSTMKSKFQKEIEVD